MTVESYAHVPSHRQQRARPPAREDATPGAVIAAVFPAAPSPVCPKVRCMQIIAELGGTGRECLHRRVRLAQPRRRPRPQHPRIRTLGAVEGTQLPHRRRHRRRPTRNEELEETRPGAWPRRRVGNRCRERAHFPWRNAPCRGDRPARDRVSPMATACSKPMRMHRGEKRRGGTSIGRAVARHRNAWHSLAGRNARARRSRCSPTAAMALKLLVTRGAGERGYAPPPNPGCRPESSRHAAFPRRRCRPAPAPVCNATRVATRVGRDQSTATGWNSGWRAPRSNAPRRRDEGLMLDSTMRSARPRPTCSRSSTGAGPRRRSPDAALPGLPRTAVARDRCGERNLPLAEVEAADAVFPCNAVRGILSVAASRCKHAIMRSPPRKLMSCRATVIRPSP